MSRPIPEGVEPPDKDALIRELVRVAERANQLIYPMGDRDYELPDGYHIDGYLEAQQAATELSDALTLARTTCPEAFEEIQQQTQIDAK